MIKCFYRDIDARACTNNVGKVFTTLINNYEIIYAINYYNFAVK